MKKYYCDHKKSISRFRRIYMLLAPLEAKKHFVVSLCVCMYVCAPR
jgi:hypothetical protein